MMPPQDWENLLQTLRNIGLAIEGQNRQTGKIVLRVYPLPRQNIRGTV
jgi:hypothetical protein